MSVAVLAKPASMNHALAFYDGHRDPRNARRLPLLLDGGVDAAKGRFSLKHTRQRQAQRELGQLAHGTAFLKGSGETHLEGNVAEGDGVG